MSWTCLATGRWSLLTMTRKKKFRNQSLHPGCGLLLLQRIKPYAIQMASIFHQVFCRKRLPMRWVNQLWVECNHLLPRLLVLLQAFNPDDSALDTGEVVHGGIATEQDAIIQHRDMVRSMARGLDDLKRQGQGLERIGIDRDEPWQICLLNR